jgi:hypothetical protein
VPSWKGIRRSIPILASWSQWPVGDLDDKWFTSSLIGLVGDFGILLKQNGMLYVLQLFISHATLQCQTHLCSVTMSYFFFFLRYEGAVPV